MRLSGMAHAIEEQISQPNTYADIAFDERLAMIVDREEEYRNNSRLKRLLSSAKFKINATSEDIDYKHPRGLNRDSMASILSGDWISRKQNLLITGPTGCGKTYVACAIGNYMCRKGHSVRYFRSPRLFEALTIAHADGSYARLIKNLAKCQVLIIDDWGLDTLAPSQRTDLLEIMEDRHEVNSTIVTSQLPSIHWHEAIGDPTLADAILDRLLHNAHKFNLEGDSMRKIKSNLTVADQ